MRINRRYVVLGLLLVSSLILLASFVVVQAEDDACPVIVQTAIESTQLLCDSTGRDQACYGHFMLDATSQRGIDRFVFEDPGDVVDLISLKTLRLSAMDIETGLWGMARMELRANVPSNMDKNVTLLLFGDVEVDQAVEPSAEIAMEVSVRDYINVRIGPSSQSGIIGTLAPADEVTAIGRLADNSWIQVRLAENERVGWVFAELLSSDDDVEQLVVRERGAPHYEPMQAFYFQSNLEGSEAIACSTMPESGMLIQTPEGAGRINFLINEVNVRIGSTVFFQALPNGEMIVRTLEGQARVEFQGVEHVAFAGTQVRVPLGEDGTPSGPPLPPEPYDDWAVKNLPIGLLGQQIDIIPPRTPFEIQQLVEDDQNGGSDNGDGGNSDNVDNNKDKDEKCADGRGYSCTAPGQADKDPCPGNSCKDGDCGPPECENANKPDKEEKEDKDKP